VCPIASHAAGNSWKTAFVFSILTYSETVLDECSVRDNLPSVNHYIIYIHPDPAVVWGSLHIQGAKKLHHFYALTSPNINRFSKLFHCQNHEEICSNTVTKDSTTPHVCRYTTLWNVAAFHWSHHWSVGLPAWARRPAARRTHWTYRVWCKHCRMWQLL